MKVGSPAPLSCGEDLTSAAERNRLVRVVEIALPSSGVEQCERITPGEAAFAGGGRVAVPGHGTHTDANADSYPQS
jgi:hypothetical protein